MNAKFKLVGNFLAKQYRKSLLAAEIQNNNGVVLEAVSNLRETEVLVLACQLSIALSQIHTCKIAITRGPFSRRGLIRLMALVARRLLVVCLGKCIEARSKNFLN